MFSLRNRAHRGIGFLWLVRAFGPSFTNLCRGENEGGKIPNKRLQSDCQIATHFGTLASLAGI
jgi:hypothetical protein